MPSAIEVNRTFPGGSSVRIETDLPENLETEALNAIEQELRTIGLEMEREMSDALDQFGITFQGDTKKSVQSELKRTKTGFRLRVGPSAAHAQWMYYGTQPHWPPHEPIRRWARLKLGIGGTEERRVEFWDDQRGRPVSFTATVDALESATWAIRTKIAREGTRGYFGTQRDFIAATMRLFEGEVEERVQDRVANVIGFGG